MSIYDNSGTPAFTYSFDSWDDILGTKTTYEESIAATNPVVRVPVSDQSHDQFTAQNITSFVKDVVGGLAGLYSAKASVDIARVKAQTALDVAKVQGIYPKAGGEIYDSSNLTSLFVLGSIGIGVLWMLKK